MLASSSRSLRRCNLSCWRHLQGLCAGVTHLVVVSFKVSAPGVTHLFGVSLKVSAPGVSHLVGVIFEVSELDAVWLSDLLVKDPVREHTLVVGSLSSAFLNFWSVVRVVCGKINFTTLL